MTHEFRAMLDARSKTEGFHPDVERQTGSACKRPVGIPRPRLDEMKHPGATSHKALFQERHHGIKAGLLWPIRRGDWVNRRLYL